MHIRSYLRAALAACALAVAAVTPASAATVPADLRVEGPGGQDLTHGWTYYSDTATITSDASEACGGKGESHTLNGPTALGILEFARQHNSLLDPVRISDEFDFGLLVCGIGPYVASEADSAFWTYKVNHVSPEVGADQYPLKAGDEVLWVFSNFNTFENTGNELELVAPGTVEADEPFEVTVNQYDFAGVKTAAPGVQIGGGAQAVTDENGKAQITFDGEEESEILRAYGGVDIPSAPVRICVGPCMQIPKQRIFGTSGRDVIKAKGDFAEFVEAGAGNDRVDVSGDTFSDKVRCGSGRDRVIADRRDRVARNCEKVTRK